MRFLLFFLLLNVAFTAAGQVRGAVVDSATRKPLLEASVSLLSARDSALVQFSITDGDGLFSIPNVAPGRYRVLITYVGYAAASRAVTVPANRGAVDAGTFRLRPATQELGEVVVKQERAPVAVRGDTVEFNAGSFKTRPNVQVEDLLKKLPGIEVARDGTIKAQGQEVKRVLVDGKPFFGDDPKMATRNLPADIVDKVQLFAQQSEQSQFSGVDDGDRQQTINISTKPDRRRGTFGQQAVGVGTNERYQARASINRFSGQRQMSFIGQANNVNQQGFTARDMGLGGLGGGGFGGGGFGGQGLVVQGGQGRGGSFGSGMGGNQPNAITRSLLGGLNYRDVWSKRTDVAMSYFLSDTRTLTDQQSLRQTIVNDSTLSTRQQNVSDNRNQNHRLNGRLESRLDTFTTLRFIPNLTWSASAFGSQTDSRTLGPRGQFLNSSLTDYTSTGNGLSGNTSLLLLRKFARRGRTLSANYTLSVNDQNTVGFNRAQNEFANVAPNGNVASPARRINQRNTQLTDALTHGLTLSYTEPLNLRQTLEFHYALSTSRNTSNRAVDDFNEQTSLYDRPNALLSNRFLNGFMTNRAGATWQTRRLKYTYALGFDVQQARLSSDNQTRDTAFSRQYVNLLPNALFTYNLARSRTLRINYRTRINAPSVSQLQPVPDNTNPLNIRLGNPNLRPEFAHNLTLFYNNFQAGSSRSLFASVTGTLTQHKIVNATFINRVGAQTTQPINVNGYGSLTGFVAVGRPVQFSTFKANLNLNTNASYNRGQSLLNGQPNLSNAWLLSQSATLNSNFNEKFEVSVGGSVAYQVAEYSLQPAQNTEFLNPALTADVFWQLPGRFTISSDVAYQRFAGRSAGLNQTFTLWNVALSRQFFKNQQGELRLSVYDLLNQNRSVVRNITDTYVEEVQSRVLNRYVMLSFIYNLRNFVGAAPEGMNRRSNRGGGRRRS